MGQTTQTFLPLIRKMRLAGEDSLRLSDDSYRFSRVAKPVFSHSPAFPARGATYTVCFDCADMPNQSIEVEAKNPSTGFVDIFTIDLDSNGHGCVERTPPDDDRVAEILSTAASDDYGIVFAAP